MQKVSFFWFRRDLRLEDNVGLSEALKNNQNVIPIFIFDQNIISELPKNDARISFIYHQLKKMDEELKKKGSSMLIEHGNPIEVWKKLNDNYQIESVSCNKDYEPYALNRDKEVANLLKEKGIGFNQFKDQVIHEESEVMKDDGTPYTVFTPYKKRWLSKIDLEKIEPVDLDPQNLHRFTSNFPILQQIGFVQSPIKVIDFDLSQIKKYEEIRNFPAVDATSYLSPHLRFGTVGIRTILKKVKRNPTFVSELIWREFFMQILFHFPSVVDQNFKRKYDGIEWRNNEEDFEKWKNGRTGYTMVDAGMRQLNQTGYMHNRVRMITASFLCKHLLIDWRWGEAYFAQKLLDYDLSANNGNWQWAAGTGCDAAPYFRIFNPMEQQKKFDSDFTYVKRWIPELENGTYAEPMVDHKFARARCLDTYKSGLEESTQSTLF